MRRNLGERALTRLELEEGERSQGGTRRRSAHEAGKRSGSLTMHNLEKEHARGGNLEKEHVLCGNSEKERSRGGNSEKERYEAGTRRRGALTRLELGEGERSRGGTWKRSAHEAGTQKWSSHEVTKTSLMNIDVVLAHAHPAMPLVSQIFHVQKWVG